MLHIIVGSLQQDRVQIARLNVAENGQYVLAPLSRNTQLFQAPAMGISWSNRMLFPAVEHCLLKACELTRQRTTKRSETLAKAQAALS